MGKYFFIIIFMAGVLSPFVVFMGHAGDLDDGISKYTEDGISKYDELGRIDKNIKYIKMQAKGRAMMRQLSAKGNAVTNGTSSGQANMNSVVLGAGGVIRGDVIIIDESRGPKTQIVDK